MLYKIDIIPNNCTSTNVSHVVWTLSHGDWIGNNLTLIGPTRTMPGIGGPGWYWPQSCGLPFTITAEIHYVSGVVFNVQKVVTIPCCDENDPMFKSNQPDDNSGKDIRLFPNPAKTELYIQGVDGINGKIEIQDLSGKVVLSQHLSSEPINLTKISSGTYLLVVINENGEFIK